MTLSPRLALLVALPALTVGCNNKSSVDPGTDVTTEDIGLEVNAAPVITLYEPIAGTTYSWNEGVTVRALISDDDSPYEQLVNLYSDIDGLLGSFALNDSGQLSTTLTGLSEGTHTLSVSVRDPGGELAEVFVTVSVRANQAPGSPLIAINPTTPDSQDDLRAVVTNPADDPDSDSLTYVWSWDVDGVSADIADDTIPAELTSERQVWSVTGYATDGDLSSEPVTASVTIGQDGPEVTVSISPTQPYVDDDLRCVAHAGDAYGGEVSLGAAWYVGSTPAGDAADSLYDAFVKGDVVTCEVEASSERGTTVMSAAVQILNSPPHIDRTDVSPNVAYTDSDLTCVPSTTDEDGDALSFAYEWFVQGEGGATASAGSDATLDSSAFVKTDRVWCMAQADDGEDISASRESGALVILNTAPTAPGVALSASELVAGATATCALVTPSTDADYDALHYEYRWTVDGAIQSESTETFAATGALAGSLLGCAARAQDSDDSFSDWSLESTAQVID